MVKLKKRLDNMVKLDKKHSQVNNLVNRYKQKVFISFLLNISTLFPNFIFRSLVVNFDANLIIKFEDKNIKQLIKIIQNLALFIYII